MTIYEITEKLRQKGIEWANRDDVKDISGKKLNSLMDIIMADSECRIDKNTGQKIAAQQVQTGAMLYPTGRAAAEIILEGYKGGAFSSSVFESLRNDLRRLGAGDSLAVRDVLTWLRDEKQLDIYGPAPYGQTPFGRLADALEKVAAIDLKERELWVIQALKEAGRRLTQRELARKAFGQKTATGNIKDLLRSMRDRGIIDNGNDSLGRGYGLLSWRLGPVQIRSK